MQKVSAVDLEEFTQPTELFTQPNEIDPMEIFDDKTNPAENHQDNGNIPPHGTQPSSLHSPLIDTSAASELPLLCPRVNARDVSRLVIMADQLNAFTLYVPWIISPPSSSKLPHDRGVIQH